MPHIQEQPEGHSKTSDPIPVQSEPPKAARRGVSNGARIALSLLLTAALLWALASGGLPLVPRGGDFAMLGVWSIAQYALLVAVTTYFRAVRWRYLLRPFAVIDRKRVLSVVLIGSAAQVLLPLRTGELVRPHLIRQEGRLTMSGALGTVLSERIVDGLIVALILAGALILAPSRYPPSHTIADTPVTIGVIKSSASIAVVVFLTAFVGILVFRFARRFALALGSVLLRPAPPRIRERLLGMFSAFADGLDALAHRKNAPPFLLETALYWFFNVLGLWLLARDAGLVHADGSAFSFGEACALLGTLGIAVAIPGPPGMLGSFQAGLYAGLSLYVPPEIVSTRGAAFVFVVYAVQMAFTFGAAAVCLALDASAARSVREAVAARARK